MNSTLPGSVDALIKERKYVSALHEYGQCCHKAVAFQYQRSGRDHTPRWTAELHWEGRVERATAPSKQEAAAAVAERILCRPVAPAPALTLEARVTALETEVAALRALIRPLH